MQKLFLIAVVCGFLVGIVPVMAQEDEGSDRDLTIYVEPFSIELFYVKFVNTNEQGVEGACEYWGMSMGVDRDLVVDLPVATRLQIVWGSCVQPHLNIFTYNANSEK